MNNISKLNFIIALSTIFSFPAKAIPEFSYDCKIVDNQCFVVATATDCSNKEITNTFTVTKDKLKNAYPIIIDEGPTWIARTNGSTDDLQSVVLEVFKDNPSQATYQKFEQFFDAPKGKDKHLVSQKWLSECKSSSETKVAKTSKKTSGICNLSSNKKAGDKIDAVTQKRVDGLAKEMLGFVIAQGWEPKDSSISTCTGGLKLSVVTKYGNRLMLNTKKGAVSWSAKDNYDSYNALCYDYQLKKAFRSNVWCDPSLKR